MPPLRFDRDRALSFTRFTWLRFVDDKCFETAGALSYTTLVSLVPLTVAVFAILSAFPVFAEWRGSLANYAFQNFVPATGIKIQEYMLAFADKASQLTGISILVMLFSAVSMMISIEDRMNRIWRVRKPRGWTSRLLLYWAALTLGPILVVGGLVLTSYFSAASVSAFDFHAPKERLPAGAEFLGLLVVLGHFISAQRSGDTVDQATVRLCEPYLHRGTIADYFFELEQADLIKQSELGSWLLCRSLDSTDLLRVYEHSRYRLPLNPVEEAAELGIELPSPLLALLAALADEVATTLATRLNTVYPPDANRAADTKELSA
jgi:YihY family inner membrane protein